MSTRVNGVKQTVPWAKRKRPVFPESPLSDGNFVERWETLSPREKRVLSLRCVEGLNREEIADRLFISPHTVKSVLCNANRKLGIGRDQEALGKGNHGTTILPYLLGKAVARAEQRRRDQLCQQSSSEK